MAGIFDKAKKNAVVKTAAKDEKTRVTIDNPEFFDKIATLQVLNENMKRDKAKADMISDEVKEMGIEKWADLYTEKGKNPETIMLEAQNATGDTAQAMFMVTDKYIKIDEARAEQLKESYGDDIVTEETTFAFDAKMLEKYADIISELIENSDKIKDADKGQLIVATTSYNVAKGTIDKLDKYGEVATMVQEVKPVVMMKNVEVING
jgi:hypothetical protein